MENQPLTSTTVANYGANTLAAKVALRPTTPIISVSISKGRARGPCPPPPRPQPRRQISGMSRRSLLPGQIPPPRQPLVGAVPYEPAGHDYSLEVAASDLHHTSGASRWQDEELRTVRCQTSDLSAEGQQKSALLAADESEEATHDARRQYQARLKRKRAERARAAEEWVRERGSLEEGLAALLPEPASEQEHRDVEAATTAERKLQPLRRFWLWFRGFFGCW